MPFSSDANSNLQQPRSLIYFGASGMGSGSSDRLAVLSSASIGTPAAASFLAPSVVTDLGEGILYWALVTNGGSATNDQILNGSGGNIVAGKAGSVNVTAAGTITLSNITGLGAATTYQILYMQLNTTGNLTAQTSATGATL